MTCRYNNTGQKQEAADKPSNVFLHPVVARSPFKAAEIAHRLGKTAYMTPDLKRVVLR